MLKRLFCCLSLLLSLCLLFPVFSVSTSAISVDGYEVSTRVVNESGVYEEFSNTITFNSSTNQLFITVDIELSEVIPENTVFDLEIEFLIGDYLTISEYNGGGSIYDSNWVKLDGKLDGIVKDGKLSESQIVATGDVKYIRYVFDIYNPFWIVNENVSNSYVGTWKLNLDFTAYEETMTSHRTVFSGYIPDKPYGNACGSIRNCEVGVGYTQLLLGNWSDQGRIDYLVPRDGKSYDNYAYCRWVGTGRWISKSQCEDGQDYEYLRYLVIDEVLIPDDYFWTWLSANAIKQDGVVSYPYSFDFTVSSISLTQEDNTGVIGGIFGWIKRIFNLISDIPNLIGNKLTAFGNWLIDQIKGLFIPSEEAIIELKDKFEALFADRFGAAYQSIEVVEQFGQAMGISTYSDTVDTITFPSVTVPLAGTEFTFGGWEVDLVPKGFEGLITPLKLIVDLVCTIACVNMFRRRMEGVLR